jgi:molybdenum cofactor synthesis domain-containing protein
VADPARRAKVLTVSTSVHRGTREDASGEALVSRLASAGFEVVERQVSPDGVDEVSSAIRTLADGFTGLLITTGGTGFSPTDVTPEATLAVLEREAPGLAEASRSPSSLGMLSRGRAGTVGHCLVLNVPGSPRGALESVDAVLSLLPHALELLAGGTPH